MQISEVTGIIIYKAVIDSISGVNRFPAVSYSKSHYASDGYLPVYSSGLQSSAASGLQSPHQIASMVKTIEENEETAYDQNKDDDKKYRYKPNISTAITNIKEYLLGHGSEETLILRIKRYLIPIRPGRSFTRNVKPQSATTLLYRAS